LRDRPVFPSALLEEAIFPDRISFGEAWYSGAKFYGFVSFQEARFSARAAFIGAQFMGDVSFKGTRFHGEASFLGSTTFHRNVLFNGARFGGWVSFNGDFKGLASFADVVIDQRADLDGTTFSETVTFENANFSEREVTFRRTQFLGGASFRNVRSLGTVSFDGSVFSGDVSLASNLPMAMYLGQTTASIFGQEEEHQGTREAVAADFHGATFATASFHRAVFSGSADFGDTKFARLVFDEVVGTERIDFSGARLEYASIHSTLIRRQLDLSDVTFENNTEMEVATS
jgi:uncharacterized protein YjbI with pentapeptide repeats